MKRTVQCFLSVLLVSGSLISTSAFAYYQSQYNPSSRGYQGKSYGQGRIKTFTNYAAYVRAVWNAPDRYYDYALQRPATGKNVFIYDPRQLSWAAYNSSGRLVRTGPGSAGNGYCPDIGKSCRTPTGTFSVFSKKDVDYKSKQFPIPTGGAPMPHAMFFSGGSAIHGSTTVMEHNASHGCIRVLLEDAAWLNRTFLAHGSTVIIRPY
jgi:hypothetical protein